MRNLPKSQIIALRSGIASFLPSQLTVRKSVLGISLLMAVINTVAANAMAQANDEPQWWFNVELIAFKRQMLSTNNEDFKEADFAIDFTNSNQLLYLSAIEQQSTQPALENALAVCNASDLVNNRFNANLGFGQMSTAKTLASVQEIEAQAQSIRTSSSDQAVAINSFIFSASLFEALLAPIDMRQFSLAIAEKLHPEREDTDVVTRFAKRDEDLPEVVSLSILDADLPQDSQVQIDTMQAHLQDIDQRLASIISLPLSVTCVAQKPFSSVLNSRFTPLDNVDMEGEISDNSINEIPTMLFNSRETFTGYSQLVAESELYLTDYAKKVFQQSDIQPLLYTAWRQEVAFGANNAEFYQIRAGKKLVSKQQQTYDQWNKRYQEMHESRQELSQQSFFDELKVALDANEEVDWLAQENATESVYKSTASNQSEFELDGLFKVYLDYVNQVPYLHIDSEFKHFRLKLDETGDSSIATYPFKQRRRVISKQIHYFDHPAFGIVVRIERFTPPIVNQDTETIE